MHMRYNSSSSENSILLASSQVSYRYTISHMLRRNYCKCNAAFLGTEHHYAN